MPNGSYPYACKHCNRRFRTQQGLNRHENNDVTCQNRRFGTQMMNKEGMLKVEADGTICAYALKRKVEIYTCRNGDVWVPIWLIQLLKKYSVLQPGKHPYYTLKRHMSHEGKKAVTEAKHNKVKQASLTVVWRLEESNELAKRSWAAEYYVGEYRYWDDNTTST